MKRVLLAAISVLLTVGCGGGGGGGGDLLAGGGIAGTGRTTGPITGFGSIFVGGIEWELEGAEIIVRGAGGSEAELRLGMIVTVDGSIDEGGLTGLATGVRYELELEGPVESVTPIGSDGRVKELVVLGLVVVVERGETTFDGEDDDAFSFDTVAADDVVEVSGLIDEQGRVRATRLEKEGDLVLGETEVELRGRVGEFDDDSTFRLGTILVRFDDDTQIEGLPDGIRDGESVKVSGVLVAAGEVEADEIEADDGEDDGGDVDEASVEGFITDFVDDGDFRVSGQLVDATEAAIEHGTREQLQNGVRVRVEGSIVDGVLFADEVELRSRRAEVQAEVGSADDVDPAAGTLILLGIRIEVDGSTHFEDDGQPFGLADVEAGDLLCVRGHPTGAGVLRATRVELEREDERKIVLRGPVDGFDPEAGTLTVLGVEVPTDEDTDFEDIDESELSREEFFELVEEGDIVDIEDEDDGDATAIDVADEVEFED